jgi:hypothetical protein
MRKLEAENIYITAFTPNSQQLQEPGLKPGSMAHVLTTALYHIR